MGLRELNDTQFKILSYSLIGIGVILVLIFLRLDYPINYFGSFRLYVFEGERLPYNDTEWGLFARDGLFGVFLGVVAPIVLWASVAFLSAGRQRTRRN